MIDMAIIAALGLTLLLGAGFMVVSVNQGRRRAALARLAAVLPAPASGAAGEDVAPGLRRAVEKAGMGSRMLPGGMKGRLDRMRDATGGRLNLASLFFAAVAAAGIAAGFTAGPFAMQPPAVIVISTGAALIGASLMYGRVRDKFQMDFLDLFPDALDLIIRAVKAGLPALEALAAAAREMGDPVGPVLQRVIDEMRIGVEMQDALMRVADRIQVADFRFFVVCLALQKRTGGSLAETLGNLSNVLRKRKELRLRARTLSSESRASAVVLSALPIVAGGGIAIINPHYISILFTDPRGRMILALALCSLATGFAVMSAMIKRSSR